jgi:two-component system response regulator AtoC
MDRYARRYNRQPRQISEELQQLFQTYEWPGNIRELENMIKRIVILQDEQLVIREMTRTPKLSAAYAGAGDASTIAAAAQPSPAAVADEPEHAEGADADETDDDTPPEVAVAPAGSRLADVAKAAAMKAERTVIEETLGQVQWNRRRAAEQLGVSYKTLLNKIKECGINRR